MDAKLLDILVCPITKGALIQYYADVAPVLLPHIRDRAMVMRRYPNGAAGASFFMKEAPSPRPAWIRICAIDHDEGKVVNFPVIDDRPSLLWLINLGCIDLNQWYARCDDVHRPDFLHFDLDPGEGATFEQACEAAGVHAGIVDIVSLNLVNAVLASSPGAATGDWLLVYVTPGYATLIVVRNSRVIFYRNRPADTGGIDVGDMVHQTAMYYQDRLGGAAFGRVAFAGGSAYGADADRIRRLIEERLGVRVETLDVRGGVMLRDRIAAGPELLDALAPAVGVLLRDRPAARGTDRVGLA